MQELQGKSRVSRRQLERLLSAYKTSQDFWEVLTLSRLPFNTAVEASKHLWEKGIISFEDGKVFLTEEGNKLCEDNRIYPQERYICPFCEGRGITLKDWEELLEEFLRITEGRPEPLLEYDQGYLTPEATVARVVFAHQKGDVREKDIIILGDDDLLSIAFALSGLPARIVVIELDQRLVDFIEKTNKEKNTNIEVWRRDLRLPLGEELVGKFDTFFTDPVETLQGIEVFLARGIASLKDVGCAGYFGLTAIESSLEKWHDIQKLLIDKFGVTITDILWDFSIYENWGYLLDSIRQDFPPLRHSPTAPWYKSALYRIELPRGFRRLNEEGKGEIYVDEESLVWGKEKR